MPADALEASGSSTPVSLSGTAVSGGISYPFTGTGTLTLGSGTSGTFNGGAATLQTMTVTGTITVAGKSTAYPVDPGTRKVVEFTFKSYDMSGSPVETDTQSYYLSENSAMSFYGATASNASGSLSVTLQ